MTKNIPAPLNVVSDSLIHSAKMSGLRYVTDRIQGITRRRAGKNFCFYSPRGRPLRNPVELRRIKSLAVPPAWTDVWISPLSDSHLQATGRDARGRKQFRYHPSWREVRDQNKYDRLTLFGRTLPKLRRRVAEDLALPGLPRTKVMQVRPDNIRTDKEKGGGTLYDIGIYCINAARYLFGAEPTEVFAFSSANKKDPRFKEIDEMTSALLRFPDGRLAAFSSSFGAADVASYRVVGTKGDVRLDQAYEYVYPIELYVTVKGKTRKQTFRKRDQFAPELEYFSSCILNNQAPEPSGTEGIADVRVIEALYRSAKRRRPVKIEPVQQTKRPPIKQTKHRPAVDKPTLVHAESAAL